MRPENERRKPVQTDALSGPPALGGFPGINRAPGTSPLGFRADRPEEPIDTAQLPVMPRPLPTGLPRRRAGDVRFERDRDV